MVRVVVIGSACVPPGFIQLEAEPVEEFYRDVDVPGATAVRYRINNLWGMHLRCDNWLAKGTEESLDFKERKYPGIPEARVKKVWNGDDSYTTKSHYREDPLVGMSCAVFEIPHSRKVIIPGGCEVCAWTEDNFPDDVHYSFRIIRITVATGEIVRQNVNIRVWEWLRI